MAQAKDTFGGRRARATHRVLKRKFHAAGKGSVTRVEDDLGLTTGLIRSWRQGGDIRTGDLFDVLDCLAVEPIGFFIEVLDEEGVAGQHDPEELLLRSIRPKGAPPRALQWALAANGELGTAYLTQVEALGPQRIVEEIPPRLESFSSASISAALTALGSAWRSMDCISEAAHALLLAARLASTSPDKATALQRLTYVACADFDFSLAVRLAKASRNLFLRSGLPERVGQTFVDEGHALAGAKQYAEARECFKSALAYLVTDDVNNLMSVHHGIGQTSLVLGETGQALRSCRQAERLAQASALPRLKPKILWLRAGICLKEGKFSKAEKYLRTTTEKFTDLSPIDAALVSLDLIEALYSRGEVREATDVAKKMTSLVFPLSQKCKVAEVATIRLVQAAADLSLSPNEIREAREAIENGKRRTHDPVLRR